MVGLKRSFFYTLIIFCCLALMVYIALYFAPKQKSFKRTKVNPAHYISKKEQPIQKNAASKQQQKQATKKSPKKPLKKQAQKEKTLNKSQNKKQRTKQQNIAAIEKNNNLKLPEQSSELLSALKTLPKAVEAKPQLSPQESMLNEVYGDEMTKLSTTAKRYLMDNHLKMQIITQRVLNRIGRVYIDPRFHYYAHNYVEFTLYPDGHISNIKILKDAGFKLLDKITKETIETAYKDYPLPKEPTLVRYKFLYDLRSY